jgi:methylated-DNA-[protein]-cysteine S-methyltransferase
MALTTYSSPFGDGIIIMGPTGVKFHLWGRPLDRLLELAESLPELEGTANHVPAGWTGHGDRPVTANHVPVDWGYGDRPMTANHVPHGWTDRPVTANHVPHGWTGHGKQSPIILAVEAYFAGAPVDPAEWPVALDAVPEFTRRVYQAARRVKRGETATYAQIAAAAGRPNAARAVGSAMARNRVPLFVPCHRIVSSGGAGGWSGPPGLKAKLLALEGAG